MIEKNEDKNSNEKVLIAIMLLIFSISIYCMLFDNSVFGLISLSNSRNTRPVLGRISILEKDIRRKNENSFAWEDAKRGDNIRLGDRIFTGKQSSVHVDLDKGGGIDLGENTMVTFSNNDGQNLANLTFGKMQVSVDGNMKVAVNGEVQVLNGSKSQIEISVDSKKRTRFRVMKGAAQVNSKKVVEEKAPPPAPPKIEEIVVVPKLTPRTLDRTYSYTDRMYDFYELNGKRLSLRNERRLQIQYPVRLEWDTQGLVRNLEGQISNLASFDGLTQTFTSDTSDYTTRYIYLGENFWRIKGAHMEWSPVQSFRVVPEPLSVAAPRLISNSYYYYLVGDKLQLKVGLEANPQLTGFVVEYSNSPNFGPNETQFRYVDHPEFTLAVREPQDIYLRARGVNRATEITHYSPVIKLKVLEAPMPEVPRLAESSYKIYPEQTLDLEWTKAENSTSYEVELRNAANQVVDTKVLTQNSHQYKIKQIGQYQVKVSSVDRFGRKSPAASAHVAVEPHILPPVIAKRVPPPPPPPVAARKVSSVETISAPPPPEIIANKNNQYSSSRIELEGGGQSALSSQALADSSTQPENASVGLKVVNWFDHSGVEGFFGTKLAGINPASGELSPVQIEARYLYRWSIPWNLFSNINATQFSLIGGYEFYRNSVSGPYSPGYELIKTGFGLQFPVAKSWDTGGEILYGQGFDSSYQYEMSGNANYYLRSDWSIGVGYRVHLFQAGSNSTAPSGGVPYREGYGEAFSVIRKHY